MTTETVADSETTLVVERHFDAPIETVWRALTDPEIYAAWWGPRGWDVPSIVLEPRVGGVHRVEMREIETGYRNTISGTYKAVEPPTRLIYSWAWADGPIAGVETEVEIMLAPEGNGTRLRMEHRGLGSAEVRDKHRQGWSGSFDCLEEVLSRC